MNSWKRLTAVSMVVAAALASAIAPASADGGATRFVDGDGHAGPGGCGGSAAAVSSIQDAIDASGPDDTVIVCPGTYVERLRIGGDRDGLTLRSSTPFGATIKAPRTLDSDPVKTLIDVILVDDVTIQGFKIVSQTQPPCDGVQVTIFAAGSRQTSIRGNRMTAPGYDSGCIRQIGILVMDTAPTGEYRSSSATIAFNEIRDVQVNGIEVRGELRRTTVHIIGNSIRTYQGFGGESAILLLGGVRGSIQDNVIQGSPSAPSSGATFTTGITIEAGFTPQFPEYANRPIEIHDNVIRRVGRALRLQGVDELDVRRNQLTNNSDGAIFDGVLASTIVRNQIGAHEAGIQVDAASSGISFRQNTVSGPGGTCDDKSIGSDTAGTANHWTGNTATQDSDPAGICPHP